MPNQNIHKKRTTILESCNTKTQMLDEMLIGTSKFMKPIFKRITRSKQKTLWLLILVNLVIRTQKTMPKALKAHIGESESSDECPSGSTHNIYYLHFAFK